jgi:iron complex outermembrane recepter protein
MQKPSRKPSVSRAAARSGFALSATASAATLLFLGATPAFGQTAATSTETITVTGIRAAIESAILKKKTADTIVEAISAEDIGKLPDASVADSLSRLPGVSAQRNRAGNAQSISVRGMSPDFNGALLNGREVASSGDSRGVDFDLYPAELLGSVLVYKTPHAGLMGQGLSSTIDLQTVRPLSFGKRTIAVNYREQRTGISNGVPNGEGSGDRTSLSYIDQFFGRTLGVAIGYAKFTENGAVQPRVNTWGGWAPTLRFNNQDAAVPGGFGRDNEQSNKTREGLMAVLQYKPNKDFETVLDVFQSKGKEAFFKKGIEGFIGGGSDPHNYRGAPQLVSATVNNGIATSGTINNFKAVVRNHNEGTDDKLDAWGLNSRLKLGGWTATGDVGQSKVTKQGARYETTAGLPGNGNRGAAMDTISWTGFTGANFDSLKFTTGRDYSDPAVARLTDVMGWGGGEATPQAGYISSPKITDKIDNLRFSGKSDLSFGPLIGVEVGLNMIDRTKTSTTQEGFLVIKGSSDPYAAVAAPGAGKTVVDGIPVLTWDPRGSLGTIYDLRSNLFGTVINRNWSVNEKVNTAFVKADVDTEMLGRPLSGNIGAQIVSTDQSSTGFTNDSGTCTGQTPATCRSLVGGKKFTDFLPSLNLSLDMGTEQVLRLGVGRTMSRPKMGDMRANIDAPAVQTDSAIPVAQRVLRASAGNPGLEPFRATAWDLSYEKYFGNKGYFSAAAFYKEISTYILTFGRTFDFTPYITPNTQLPVSGSKTGILIQPQNGSGGTIQGIELAVNVPLNLLAKPLDGFGIALNHSDTKSSISLDTSGFPGGGTAVTTVKIPLPGLSRRVTNLRFYYEKHGLQFAVAQRKRSDFLGEITDYKDDREISFIKGETVIDLQLGYEFGRGPLKGLSILFQANNINNAKFQRYTFSPSVITNTDTPGKTYLLGLNYKL